MYSCSSSKKVSSGGNTSLSDKDQQKFQYAFFSASKEKILGNYDRAELFFEQCFKMDQNNAAVIYELARIYEMKKENNKALLFAKRAAELSPTNEWYASLLGNLYDKNGKYKDAAVVYEKLTEEHPKNLEYYYRWANALIYDDDFRGSIQVFDKIEAQVGVDEEVIIKKQKIYLSLGEIDLAIAETEKLIKKYPDQGKFYGMLAELYMQKKDEAKALEIYESQLERNPDDPYIHLSISEFYDKKGDSERAHQELLKAFENKALSIDPKVRIVLSYFTLMGLKKGEEQQAYELTKQIADTHEKEAKAHSVFGDLLYRMDSLDRAREEYRRSVELDDSKYVLWSQILLLNSELGDFKSMYEESNMALDLYPSQPAFYLFKGMSAVQLKNYSTGIEALKLGKDLVFDNPGMLSQFYSTLGDAYNATKEFSASDSSYESALEIDPENVFVLNNYSYYLSLRNEKLERAEEMSKKCVTKEPTSPTFADTHAWVLYKAGKYLDAKKWMEVAINNGASNNGLIIEHYGDVLFKIDDVEGAIKHWKRAKELGEASDKLDKKIEKGTLVE
jgi:tetratricopeptide (TPR) repeat protein